MSQHWLQHAQQIRGLFRQQLAVLIADLFRRAFQMYIDPSVALET